MLAHGERTPNIISQVRMRNGRNSAARIYSVNLIDENVTNKELGEYIRFEASNYPFEIFLRVAVSTANQHVYRYIVKGDWRSVKMGDGDLASRSDITRTIYPETTHPLGF